MNYIIKTINENCLQILYFYYEIKINNLVYSGNVLSLKTFVNNHMNFFQYYVLFSEKLIDYTNRYVIIY